MAINKAAMSYRQEKSRKLSPLDCSLTEQSTLQQDERMAHSFMDAHGCNARSKAAARSIWDALEKKLSGDKAAPSFLTFSFVYFQACMQSALPRHMVLSAEKSLVCLNIPLSHPFRNIDFPLPLLPPSLICMDVNKIKDCIAV